MIRAVKWMDEVEEEKRQKVVHEGKRWTKSSTAPRKPAWWHRCRRVGPGKRQQQLRGCRSVSRQPTDCSKSCEYEVVLTQRSGGYKLERVDSPQKGKGSCKRSNGPLHENLSKKRYSLC